MKCYYDVHVFFSRNDGYSIPVEIETDLIFGEDDVIDTCVERDLFTEDGDQYHVDYVTEIKESEYNDMKII